MDEKVLMRIQRRVNKLVRNGVRGNGILVFCKDGSGGTWYPSNTYGFWKGSITIPVPWEPVTLDDLREIVATQEE